MHRDQPERTGQFVGRDSRAPGVIFFCEATVFIIRILRAGVVLSSVVDHVVDILRFSRENPGQMRFSNCRKASPSPIFCFASLLA